MTNPDRTEAATVSFRPDRLPVAGSRKLPGVHTVTPAAH